MTGTSAGQAVSPISSTVHTLCAVVLRFRPTKNAGIPLAKETIMLHELRHRFARWLVYRQTLASLRQAPDRTLADAGISREEIRERARYASLRC
jgi:uncharacterized protein YjiS (DUF1127 family)